MARSARRKSPLVKRAFGGLFYLSICSLALLVGTGAAVLNQSPFIREMSVQAFTNRSPEEVWGGRESVNLLVLGCDEDRYYGGKQILRQQARSDMMLVAKLDFVNNRITGVSIPRDTLAAPKGYRRQKINAYHWLGGPDLSKRAVESLLPVEIDRVVVLDYKAFEDMVDLVGGVEVNVPKNMDYDDHRGGLHIHLKKGQQRLSGEDAVGFVRFRHSDDDFQRQARQKDFLVAFKSAVLHNPSKLTQVAEKARAVLGNALTDQEVASLVLFAKSVGNENIKMGMVPTVPARNYNLLVDKRRLKDVMREFHFVEPIPDTVSARR